MKNTDKVTLTVGQLKKLIKESTVRKLNENADDEIDKLYHEITHDPAFQKEMNVIGIQLASKIAEKAYAAKYNNDPAYLNGTIDGIGEFATKRIMDIAKKIIGMQEKDPFAGFPADWKAKQKRREDMINDPYGSFKNPLNQNYPNDLW